jgi:acyl-CoA reductase-like NAD-dependent aldehyde dehydrogenase
MSEKIEIKATVTKEQAYRFFEYAKETNRSRSEFLVEAAEQMIKRYGAKKTLTVEEHLKRIDMEIEKLKKVILHIMHNKDSL